MALMQCPECSRSVSTQATSCPGCGYPIKNGPIKNGPINDGRKGAIDSHVAGKVVGGLAAWLVVPWIARAIVAVVGVIALFTFLGTR